MANSLAQYLADLQVQIKEAESQLVFGEVISTSPLRVKYGEITLEDNFLFVEDGLTLTVGQEVPMLKTNRSQLFIVMLSKEFTPQEVTPEEILSKIKTVDGSGSGLDADLLDGKHASDFSLDGHTQDWTTITGKPTTFAPATHSHAWSTITSRPANNQFPNTAEAIGASKNLNNYTTPGFYYQSANANASNGSNYPVARAGTLIVTKDAGTTQMYYEYNGSGVYYRTFYGSTWTAWQNLVTPTWANVSGKPAQATRWPTWSEVTSKPSTFTPSSHNHSASNITSGSLSVARGGTGRATLTSNTVLVGNGTSAVSMVSRSGIDSRSSFPPATHTHTTGTKSTSGYVKFDNGIKINWVQVTISASTRGKAFTWPSAFTSAVYATWASSKYYDVQGEVDGATKTGGAVNAGASSNGGTVGIAITWTAYGIGV